MAERRMFAKTIIDSDAFLDMPITARLLYYDLAMRADDDGFVNSPKKIMRMIGASQDDLGILAMRKFIITFDNGVVVIKHWRIHNYIRKDTYNETTYKEQKEQLKLDENKAYTLVDVSSTDSQQLEDTGKVSLGKDNNINPPLPPKGKSGREENKTEYIFSKHTNVENAMHILNFLEYENKDWLKQHKEVWECIKVWLKYKDERKDRYKSQLSFSKLFTIFVNNVKTYGIEAVTQVVDRSIAAGYQEVTWDKLKKYPVISPNTSEIPTIMPTVENKESDKREKITDDEWEEGLNEFLDREEKNVQSI